MIILSYRVSSKPARVLWEHVSNKQTTKKLCFYDRIHVWAGEIYTICVLVISSLRILIKWPWHLARTALQWTHHMPECSEAPNEYKVSVLTLSQYRNAWLSSEGPELVLKAEKKEQWHFKNYLWLQTLIACHYTRNNDIESKGKIKQPIISIRSFLIRN